MTRLITCEADLEEGVAMLARDARWRNIAELVGPLPLRLSAGGFRGLANIIVD